MIFLWLDDIRPAPSGWTHVTNVEEAQTLLKTGKVQKASLDHDLGSPKTGYDLVKWMAETNTWPQEKPVVHSWNPAGRRNMEEVIDRHFKTNTHSPTPEEESSIRILRAYTFLAQLLL